MVPKTQQLEKIRMLRLIWWVYMCHCFSMILSVHRFPILVMHVLLEIIFAIFAILSYLHIFGVILHFSVVAIMEFLYTS